MFTNDPFSKRALLASTSSHKDDSVELFSLESESFYILSFISFMNNFKNTSEWQFRYLNNGLFALTSIIFVFAQMITLFDLAYQEALADYLCKGNAARPAVVICGTLMLFLVTVKMLPEERKCLGERVVLIRHGTEFTYFMGFYKLFFDDHKIQTLKLLLFAVFHNFRVYGVTVFVYVAAVEQLMLFDEIIDYVINAVVVLLVAEADELLYFSLTKLEILPYGHLKNGRSSSNGVAGSHRSNITSDLIDGFNEKTSFDGDYDETGQLVQPTGSQHPIGEGTGLLSVSAVLVSQEYEPARQSYIQHLHTASTFEEMGEMVLSKHERDVFLTYDYFIARLNFLCMLAPVTYGKTTGMNCSLHSKFRISEITMFLLMVSRILLNVYVDVTLVKHKFKGPFMLFRHVLWSLLEHGVPCALYLLLMYYVFIYQLTPRLP